VERCVRQSPEIPGGFQFDPDKPVISRTVEWNGIDDDTLGAALFRKYIKQDTSAGTNSLLSPYTATMGIERYRMTLLADSTLGVQASD